MLSLLVTGTNGRMGQAVLTAAAAEPEVKATSTHHTGEDIDAAMAQATCAIDFTVHGFTSS